MVNYSYLVVRLYEVREANGKDKRTGKGGGGMGMYLTLRFSADAYRGVVITVMETAKRHSVRGGSMREFENG